MRAAALAAALAVGLVAAAGATPRIVAVGDVHGSIDGLEAILVEAGLLDEDLHWAGGNAVLVQLGDLLDRGARVREVMDLLIRLQEEAAADGGRVVCLLGNHEGMNLLGILRDVNPEMYAEFVDGRSEKHRTKAWREQVRAWRRRAELLDLAQPEIGRELRRRWEETVPLGALEYLEAIGPEGRYGAWLRSHRTAVVIGTSLFVHAGISPDMPERDPAAISARVAGELAAFDRIRGALAAEGLVLPTAPVSEVAQVAGQILARAPDAQGRDGETLRRIAASLDGIESVEEWYLLSSDGPMWYRGAAERFQDRPDEDLLAVLGGFDVERMVVGHTPRATGRIEARFDGRVFLIDTGMLSSHYTGGQPSALEIDGDRVTAVYLDDRFVLTAEGWEPAETALPAPAAAAEAAGIGPH
jgi:hypothetical protein